MHRAYSAAYPAVRQPNTFFRRFLTCYCLGTLLGLLAARAAWTAMGGSLEAMCGGVDLAGRGARLALLRSGALSFLVVLLLSQLSGRAFWLMTFVVGKAFGTAYVFGVLYLVQRGRSLGWFQWAVHTALILPVFYGLLWHCQRGRLGGSGRYWAYHRLLPVLLAFGYLLLAAGLEALLFARP